MRYKNLHNSPTDTSRGTLGGFLQRCPPKGRGTPLATMPGDLPLSKPYLFQLLAGLCLSSRQFRLVLLFGQVVPTDPGKSHLIDGAACPGPNPVLRIRVEPVAGGVIPPADDVQQRPGRHDWRHARIVVVDGMPVVVPPGAGDRFSFDGLARVDQFKTLIFPANMHMRLPGDDARRRVQTGVSVPPRAGVRRNVDIRSGLLPKLLRPLN